MAAQQHIQLPTTLVRVPTNQLHGKLQDFVESGGVPTIPVREDTNRGEGKQFILLPVR